MRQGLFLSILFTISLFPNALANEKNPEPEHLNWNAISHRPDFCGTGSTSLVTGMGDMNGTPLELKYVDSSEHGGLKLFKDEVPDSQSWNKWNKDFVAALKRSFSSNSQRVNADDKLVVASAQYDITKNRQIRNIEVDSPNQEFENMVRQSLKSLDGSSCLQFPHGTRHTTIHKKGRFSQNFGPLFIKKTGSDDGSSNPE